MTVKEIFRDTTELSRLESFNIIKVDTGTWYSYFSVTDNHILMLFRGLVPSLVGTINEFLSMYGNNDAEIMRYMDFLLEMNGL